MPTTLTMRDETAGGETIAESVLELLTERITVRELIRSRVYQEVQDYNLKKSGVFHGLVQPTDAQQAPKGFKMPKGRQIEWNEQFDAAVDAFARSRFLILVGDRQMDNLDDEIVVEPGVCVSFLKIVPLVGG